MEAVKLLVWIQWLWNRLSLIFSAKRSIRTSCRGTCSDLDGGGHHRQRRHATNLRGTRGRRHSNGHGRGRRDAISGSNKHLNNHNSNNNNTGAPPRMGAGAGTAGGATSTGGRYVPHVVVVSLDNEDGTLGKVLEATPLGSKASSVTCVKFSPSAEFCLLGYGVREQRQVQVPNPAANGNGLGDGPGLLPFHPVNALYRIRGGMTQVATMLSENDDVNIVRFHPESGVGFVYGTKQGRVRVLGPRPWNYYYD